MHCSLSTTIVELYSTSNLLSRIKGPKWLTLKGRRCFSPCNQSTPDCSTLLTHSALPFPTPPLSSPSPLPPGYPTFSVSPFLHFHYLPHFIHLPISSTYPCLLHSPAHLLYFPHLFHLRLLLHFPLCLHLPHPHFLHFSHFLHRPHFIPLAHLLHTPHLPHWGGAGGGGGGRGGGGRGAHALIDRLPPMSRLSPLYHTPSIPPPVSTIYALLPDPPNLSCPLGFSLSLNYIYSTYVQTELFISTVDPFPNVIPVFN